MILSILLLFCLAFPVGAQPMILSPAAIVIDAETGRILWAKNIHERRAPASLTKMLSALLVLENAAGNEIMTVSTAAARVGGASAGLRTGERVSVQNMLLGMFYRSGNDAAVALSEHVSGSVEQFTRLMNVRAHSIGMTQSNFSNSHGLDESNHYSTAYDLALLTKTVLQNQSFAQMARGNYIKVRWGDEVRDIWNINSFLWRYNGATGVKTGYTSRAGYCLAASAQQGSTTLILVLLGASTSNQRWSEAIRVLDYTFLHYNQLMNDDAKSDTTQTQVHQVKWGETLSDIALLYRCSVDELVQHNNLTNPNMIRVGQSLRIP